MRFYLGTEFLAGKNGRDLIKAYYDIYKRVGDQLNALAVVPKQGVVFEPVVLHNALKAYDALCNAPEEFQEIEDPTILVATGPSIGNKSKRSRI